MDATLTHLTFLRAYFGRGDDGSIAYSSGTWRWTPRGGVSEVITTVAGKWTVSGSSLYLIRSRFQFSSATVPGGSELVFGAPSMVVMPLVQVAGVMTVAGVVRAETIFSGNRTRAGVRKTTAGGGNPPTWQNLVGGCINTPAPSGSGGGCGTFTGGTGMTAGTDRPHWIIRTTAPMAVAASTTAGTTPSVNSTGGLAYFSGTFDDAPRLPGEAGFPGGGGALSQTGTGSYGGQGGGGATTSPEGTSKLGAFGGGVVQLQVRTLALGLSARIHADGESSGNGEAGSASGANLTIAGGGSGGAGGGGGQVLIQVGRLTIDGVDYTTRLTDSAVTSRITVAGGAAGTGGMGRTRVDSAAGLTAWSASETVAGGVFRRARSTSISWSLPPSAPTDLVWGQLGVSFSGDAQKIFTSSGSYGGDVRQMLSLDGGSTWSNVGTPIGGNVGVRGLATAVSADGTTLAAAVYFQGLYRSTDNGSTWSFFSSPSDEVPCLGLSGTGANVVLMSNASIYVGTFASLIDRKQFDSDRYGAPCFAISRDGSKLIVRARNGSSGSVSYYAYSNDGGATWTTVTNQFQNAPFNARFAYSASGGKLAMVIPGGGIYISSNNGASWSTTSAGAKTWTCVSWFDGGSCLIAGTDGEGVWVSFDAGATWSNSGLPTTGCTWTGVTGSDDGLSFVALYIGATNGIYRGSTGPVNSFGYVALAPGGITGTTRPTLPETAGQTVVDGTVTWLAVAEGENDAPAFKGGDGVAGSAGMRVIERVQI